MTAVDWVVFGVLVVSCLAGLMRGLVREAAALAGWVLAFFVARLLAPQLAPWLTFVENESLRYVAAMAGIMVLVLLMAWMLALVLGGMVKWAGLGFYDKALGLVFGVARGVLILTLVSLLASLTFLSKTESWHNAISRGWLETAAIKTKPWLPPDLAAHVQFQ